MIQAYLWSMPMYERFDCLIGKKLIEPSSLSDDKEVMAFKAGESTVLFKAEGNCCSYSWVEHFDVVPAGETITGVVAKEVTELQPEGYNKETNSYDECIQQYFYEIKTDKGSYTIEMRNESNGYYGGYFNVEEIVQSGC